MRLCRMCGRFLNRIPASEIARIFGTTNPLPNHPARYNIAPTQDVLAVRFNPTTHERSLDPLRWGLVPHFAKDMSFGARCINARCETLATTPAFCDSFVATHLSKLSRSLTALRSCIAGTVKLTTARPVVTSTRRQAISRISQALSFSRFRVRCPHRAQALWQEVPGRQHDEHE
jgi:hypothetical protein